MIVAVAIALHGVQPTVDRDGNQIGEVERDVDVVGDPLDQLVSLAENAFHLDEFVRPAFRRFRRRRRSRVEEVDRGDFVRLVDSREKRVEIAGGQNQEDQRSRRRIEKEFFAVTFVVEVVKRVDQGAKVALVRVQIRMEGHEAQRFQVHRSLGLGRFDSLRRADGRQARLVLPLDDGRGDRHTGSTAHDERTNEWKWFVLFVNNVESP